MPKELGYRYPAEWVPQEAVWFAWPVRDDLWPGVPDRVRHRMAELYVLAARYQPVRVLCPESAQTDARERLRAAGGGEGIAFFDYATDDVWCRDFGPLFLVRDDGAVCATDWRFNAWGGKFPQFGRDDQASRWMTDALGMRRFVFERVLEGGAVESDGAGSLMTTESVLLNPNRNGVVDRDRVSAWLKAGLGADEVLWLCEGLAGDDTDGHIDNVARFFRPDGILLAAAEEGVGANAERLAENEARVRAFRTAEDRPFATVRLPLPNPVEVGDTLAPAASYLNYLVLNGAVLVPAFGQPEKDAEAREILGDCFPGREVVGFDCRDFLREGGGLHCLSLNQPAGAELSF